MSIPFMGITLLRSGRVISFIIYQSLTFNDVLSIVTSWILVYFMIYGFLKYQLYYMRYDKKTILTGWYMNQQRSLLEGKNYDGAYQYAQKLAELRPDSVFVWCHMALLCELGLKAPDKADQYLAKAKEVLNSIQQPTDNDKVTLELCIGNILRERDNLQESLEHFKKAYNLDPTPFRKEEYEKAVEMVNINSHDSDESEELT